MIEVVGMDKARLENTIEIIVNSSHPINEEDFLTACEYKRIMLYWGTMSSEATEALAALRREEEKLNQ